MSTIFKNLVLFSFFYLIISILGHAQWVSNYRAPSHTDANIENAVGVGVAADNNKNCYVTGYVLDDLSGTDNILTIKYNKRGDSLWTRYCRGTDDRGNNKSYDITIDNSGNAYVLGQVSMIETGLDLVLLKYSPDGTEIWREIYNVSNDNSEDAGLSLKLSGEFVYVTGFVTGLDGHEDAVIIKYNSNGIKLWTSLFDGPENLDSRGYGIVVDNSGNVYVTGYTASVENGSNIFAVKYDALSGEQLWFSIYNGRGNGEDKAFGIVADQMNNVYITGYSYETHRQNSSNFDCITLKYNTNGQLLWKNTFNGETNGEDKAIGIVSDDIGNVFITGYTKRTSKATSNFDYVTIKYNTNGEQQWGKFYNGTGNGDDQARSITLIPGQNIAVTGASWGTEGNFDFATIAYNKNDGGMLGSPSRWSMNSYSNDYANDITAISTGVTYVTGFSRFNESNGNSPVGSSVVSTVSINWGDAIGQNTGNNSPERFILHQNYPNPFNPSTTISYDVLKASEIRIVVYDFLGREVSTLVNEYRKEGTYTVKFNASSLASGIYFYEIASDGYRDTKKMTLIK